MTSGSKRAKLWRSEIQDGRSGSTLLKKMPPELKLENPQTTSRPWTMARFQNICTEVFIQWPSTKIAKIFTLGRTKWRPELKKKKKKKKKPLRPKK